MDITRTGGGARRLRSGGSTLGGVTDTDFKIEDEPIAEEAPESIATHYLTSVDEVVEHLRAASQLGLGVSLRSYLEADEDTDVFAERWEFELLTSSPVHHEEAEAAAPAPEDTP